MYQTHDPSLGEAIPKAPLRVVDFSQRMAANLTISNSVYALRELLEVFESHRDVEPIQYMLSLWSNLLMNSPQTGIAIGKDCDRSGFVDSAMPERKTDRAHRLGASVAHKGKACSMSIMIQRLASNDLEVSFRSSVSISYVSTIEADYQFFAGPARRSSSEELPPISEAVCPPSSSGCGRCWQLPAQTKAEIRRGNLRPFETASEQPSWP